MKNKYEIRKSSLGGISLVEVWGTGFCHEDLYELIGKEQFMSTFAFKPGTEAYNKFGRPVTGLIFYAKGEAETYGRSDDEGAESAEEKLKIDSRMPELTQAQREDLKYGGLPVGDIEYISFLPYRRDQERHETGEKIVPNIIYIPYEKDPRVDYDILYQSYIASKINSDTELIPYEKEKFIGITLGINDGHIDSRLLDYLGFDIDAVRACQNIWYHTYKTKERRGKISQEEMSRLSELESIRWLENTIKLFDQIKKSGVNSKELSRDNPDLKTILSSLAHFEPSILLHGKKQVFWNVDSYLHIVLRHVKQLQVGHYKNKTPFPYKFEDLQVLIEQVLGVVEDEIKRHFKESSGKGFVRHGTMSVLFNGDYYCLGIGKGGRLLTLYVNGRKG